MQKFTLFLIVFLSVPIFLGATTSEEARRIEEEKRQRLRPSEATLQKRQTPLPKKKSSIERSVFDRLLDQEEVTVGDGKELVQLLKDQAIVVEASDGSPLSRGLLGQMICEALDIKGGLTMRIFGPRKRYAHKELVSIGIMFPGSSREYVNGKELIVSIIQAIDYMTEGVEDEN